MTTSNFFRDEVSIFLLLFVFGMCKDHYSMISEPLRLSLIGIIIVHDMVFLLSYTRFVI